MLPEPRQSNELILNPGEYAFLQDSTKGNVQTHVGPIVVTQSGQLRPIQFRGDGFIAVHLEASVEPCAEATKGQYLILQNPTIEEDGLKHPVPSTNNTSVPDLVHGTKIIVPGPCKFALWPEQIAQVLNGHHLRTNQYLVVRIYDEDAAKANWGEAVIKVIDEEGSLSDAKQLDLTLGKLLIIRGDEVSFYIPPTGVEVIPDKNGEYVRNALTLEMSEYCILVDQNGNKRYEKGPQVVFPSPTEEFYTTSSQVKFKPIELTPTQGLHIKINCDYKDKEWPATGNPKDDFEGKQFREGDELFITGETHPIYYPREEHSIVSYGDNLIHYATAVSAGRAYYVMNKETGVTETRPGPDMLLLDPRKEVFLTRVLSDAEVHLMYPGNHSALVHNRKLKGDTVDESLTLSDIQVTRSALSTALPDQIHRKTKYTEPHSVTLDDRFKGAPTLSIWTGYAVLLVKADGSRRVEVGPKVVTLDYDEKLAALHLSTGKPKNTDHLLTTGYLEIANNKVGDIIQVETKDGVFVDVKVSYRVTFTGDPDKWFQVDNYVKFLCDHCRSRLKGAIKKIDIQTLHDNPIDIVRDTIIGRKPAEGKRPGLLFHENGMHITEVEILGIEISDSEINSLLTRQQRGTITNKIRIDEAKQKLKLAEAEADVSQKTSQIKEVIRQLDHSLRLAALADDGSFAAKMAESEFARLLEEEKKKDKEIEIEVAQFESELDQRKKSYALAKEELEHQTEQMVARFKAAEGDFTQAIRELSDKKIAEVVAKAIGPMSLIGGVDFKKIINDMVPK